jgi:hypothetical protein
MKINDTTKGLLFGVAVTAIILYYYFKQKNDALIADYENKIDDLELKGEETAKKNEDFLALNENCDMLGDFKYALNFFIGTDYYDSENFYDSEFQAEMQRILANTTHFYNENNDIRKAFLYDICQTVANAVEGDIVPREYNYQYTAGVLSIGDKGNDVIVLQQLVNAIYNRVDYTERLEENGTYDKATALAVTKLFAGTTALIDTSKGTISKEFVNNFTNIISNIKNN